MESQMKKNRGFSLIELLVAITLLSVIMLMVTQFMGTSSSALTRTKKNMNLQTEAMEVGTYLSDTIVQATYIRVRAQGDEYFEFDTSLDGNRKKRSSGSGNAFTGDLVVDNYPNYQDPADADRRIILNESNYTLVNEDKPAKTYPLDTDGDSGDFVKSLRLLTSDDKQYYVKPEYIYLRYKEKIEGNEKEAYVIFRFKDKEVYMYRDLITASTVADGFKNAVSKVNSSGSLLTEQLADCYFSADSNNNTVFLDMLFESKRFNQYTYNYAETILLRNTNVLTVPPQKLYKVK